MKKFLSYALYPLLGLVIIIAIVSLRSFVFTQVTIATGSMAPQLPVGSEVFIVDDDSLEPGDVITFKQATAPRPTTHEFLGYAEDGSLITKGVANTAVDVYKVPLQQSDVLGKVAFSWTVLPPSFWKSPQGHSTLLAIGGSLLIIAAIAAFIYLLRKPRKSEPTDKVREETPETTRDESRELTPV